MSNTILKKQIHKALDRISDERALKAFHTMITMQAKIDKNNSELTLTADQWKEVEKRHNDYLSGREKYISFDGFTKNINDLRESLIKKRGDISAGRRRI